MHLWRAGQTERSPLLGIHADEAESLWEPPPGIHRSTLNCTVRRQRPGSTQSWQEPAVSMGFGGGAGMAGMMNEGASISMLAQVGTAPK